MHYLVLSMAVDKWVLGGAKASPKLFSLTSSNSESFTLLVFAKKEQQAMALAKSTPKH